MSDIVITIVPAFVLIAIGYGAARTGLVIGAAADGLRQFVFLFAIPALLFRTMVEVDVGDAAPWGLWGAYFSSVALVWGLAAVMARSMPALAPAGGVPASMAAVYGNLVMLGLPLALAHFGPAAALPAGLILSIHAPIMLFAATMMAEWAGRGAGKPIAPMLNSLVVNLVTNPIIAALVAGALWRLTGWGLHPVPDRVITLLAEAGVPAALFALGLSLASHGLKGQVSAAAAILVFKMALFPALAWLFVTRVFDVSPIAAGIVVLFAATPPGANTYLFAGQYNAAVAPISGAIALGTGIAPFTIAILLWLLGPG